MSLINDALKKAQKQRTGEAPPLAAMPGVGGQPAARIAHRTQPAGYGLPYRQIGLGLGAVIFLVVGSVYLGRFLSSGPAETPRAKSSVAGVASPKPESGSVVKAPPSPAPTFVLTLPAPAASTPPPTVTAIVVAPKPVFKAPPTPAPAPEPVKPAEPPAKLDIKAINFIESLRVAGIRASATDSKVLMNDRVYRVGHIVEHEMGLKLTEITANSLTFEDERGASYTRNF